MKTLQIDDDVYTYIVSKIRAFGETESTVLRRELGLIKAGATPPQRDTTVRHDRFHPEIEPTAPTRERSGKSPKADLETLIAMGVLQVGQPLYLCDYQKKIVS
jgi:negative regulator of replication initiation